MLNSTDESVVIHMTIELANLIISSIILFFFLSFDVLIVRFVKFLASKIAPRYEKNVEHVRDDYDEDFFSIDERERIKREREFDDRINRMKDELADKHVVQRKGTTAETLHPDVRNLPHNIIPNHTNDDLPDVEITR